LSVFSLRVTAGNEPESRTQHSLCQTSSHDEDRAAFCSRSLLRCSIETCEQQLSSSLTCWQHSVSLATIQSDWILRLQCCCCHSRDSCVEQSCGHFYHADFVFGNDFLRVLEPTSGLGKFCSFGREVQQKEHYRVFHQLVNC
jgi:hypothetical protein